MEHSRFAAASDLILESSIALKIRPAPLDILHLHAVPGFFLSSGFLGSSFGAGVCNAEDCPSMSGEAQELIKNATINR
jgi:hypothetical protein